MPYRSLPPQRMVCPGILLELSNSVARRRGGDLSASNLAVVAESAIGRDRQPERGDRTVIGALCPINSVVRELAFLSLVKQQLSRLEESRIRQLPVRSCRFSFRRPERCAARKPPRARKMKLPKHLQHINPHAAGIDVGCRSHFVAVPEGSCEQPVREFTSFTDDLHRMADWLLACGVSTVAMESTGIYWIPVFEILESRGLRGAAGQRAACEERARPKERRARLPVAAAAAQLWVAGGGLPARASRCARCAPMCASG